MDWNKVPSTVRHLIEGLRGGSERTMKDGKIESMRFFRPRQMQGTQSHMPRALRGYQLHNQEAALGINDRKTYGEYRKEY